MSTMTFGQKIFKPIPPDKGSFPLDHLGECKAIMISYMKCMSMNENENSKCRQQSRDYLQCRMDHNLMQKEDWKKLGLDDVPSDIKKTEAQEKDLTKS